MAGVFYRGLLSNAAGGGVANLYDDEFSVGSVIDTTGSRYASAIPWTLFGTGSNFTSQAVAGGQLSLATVNSGTWFPHGGHMPVPVGDWTFETQCSLASAVANNAIGIYMYEIASGKELAPDFFEFAGGPNVGCSNTAGGLGGAGFTSAPAMSGKLEIARASGALTMRYDVGSGWATLYSGRAQTTDFTVGPDLIGLFVAPRRSGGGGDTGVFDYWRKTA